jgi:hypothetical protein
MKTIYVNVQIQLQVTEEQEVELVDSVKDQLELINTIIGISELASEPIILVEQVDESYIYEI